MELHGITVKRITTGRKSRTITSKEGSYEEVSVITQVLLEVVDMESKAIGDLRELMYQQGLNASIGAQLELRG